MRKLARQAGRVDAWLELIEGWIAVTCLTVIVAVTGLGVFFRYVLSDPLIWSNAAGILAMMWLTFIGGSYLFKSDGHISIAAVPSLLPPTAWTVLRTAFVAMILITVLAVAWQMLTLIPLQHRKEIDVLSVPRSVYGIPLFWAMLSIAFSAVVKIALAVSGETPSGETGQTAGL